MDYSDIFLIDYSIPLKEAQELISEVILDNHFDYIVYNIKLPKTTRFITVSYHENFDNRSQLRSLIEDALISLKEEIGEDARF